MTTKLVTPEMVNKALASLDAQLGEEVVKASDSNLDQPEGADLGNPAKDKMSDEAKGKSAEKSVKKEESEDEEAGEDDGGDVELSMKNAKKSFAELPTEVQEQVDVSAFLKSLVEHTGATIDALSEAIVKSEVAHDARLSGLSEQISGIQNSQAKIGLVLKALCEKAGILSSAPARSTKSETVAKSGDVAERKFAQEENSGEEKMFKSLSSNPMEAKGQITDALIDMVKSNVCSDMDLINFESTNYLRPEVVAHLKTKL